MGTSRRRHLSDYVRRTATISGMAAFFSALFGTPLTAALFAMMVEDVGLTFTSAFMPAFTSALIAYGVSLFFGIAPTNFVLNSIPHLTLETALQTALLGIACAAVTRLFCWTLHTLEHGIPKRIPNPWFRSDWIKYEIDESVRMNKPILAIQPCIYTPRFPTNQLRHIGVLFLLRRCLPF